MSDPDLRRRFCTPQLTDLYDPAILPGVVRAAERLVHAVRMKQRIVIYGDYDVDGITGAAVLYHIIRTADPEASVRIYIPHRIDEGYGINAEAIVQLISEGADLIVSVDCGITAVEPARIARSRGVDLIITDHHNLPRLAGGEGQPITSSLHTAGDMQPGEKGEEIAGLPDCFAIVHPRLPGSTGSSEYPFGDLCGAGVAFKLAWQFAVEWCGSQRVGQVFQKTLLEMLPLVALGTIADVVPLVNENRVLARFGLDWIKQTSNIGLRALIEQSDLLNETIDCHKVGFVLAPRLNACGRMGHAAEAAQMLITDDPVEAMTIAEGLSRFNRRRQETERQIAEEAAHLAEDCGMTTDDCRAIVLAAEHWHPGVVGIVCSRLVDQFGRPTILLQRQGDVCKGSGRSIEGYSLHGGLSAVSQHLLTFGGHDMAAGLSLESERLDAFREAFVAHANESIPCDHLVPMLRVDCDAALSELTIETIGQFRNLSPFGRANPRPALLVSNVTVNSTPRQIGANGRHLEFHVRQDIGETGLRTQDDSQGAVRGGLQAGSHRCVMRCLWWNAASRAADLAAGMPLDIVIEPKINEWKGRRRIEAEVRDVRVIEPATVTTIVK